ncbi:hypothetical protein V2J09_000750 [Rumex salicifolius]
MSIWRFFALGFCVWQLYLVPPVSANAVFEVEHKFKGKDISLSDYKTHDDIRHGRILDDVDLPLGGNGNPTGSGLYYTRIQLGNPAKDYHVQVDTGSDILWVNCAGCEKCPDKSDLGLELTRFDPKASNTSKSVTCDADECSLIYSGVLAGCIPKTLCFYQVKYGDGSSSSGYFVQDYIHYTEGSANHQNTTGSGSVVFGCGAKQEGQLSASGEAVDGIMGFGQAKSSVLSQLTAANKVKKMFSHCLDGRNGGGIFAIGEIVEPKLNTTPLIPAQTHYNVIMKSVEVAGEVVELPFLSQAAIIDSGTTLAYIPDDVYKMVMKAITSKQPRLEFYTVDDQFQCFEFNGNVENGFPPVKFHFGDSLTFTVYPHEYLFEIRDDTWCIGWQNGGEVKDGSNSILLGDMVLSNKLVLYDLENQVLGWTEYNCSSSIKVKGGDSEAPSSIPYHDISPAYQFVPGFMFVLISMLVSIMTNGGFC